VTSEEVRRHVRFWWVFSGTYEVIRLLPTDGDDCQNRIKSPTEAFERVAKESQLDISGRDWCKATKRLPFLPSKGPVGRNNSCASQTILRKLNAKKRHSLLPNAFYAAFGEIAHELGLDHIA
jgi:hypothetical protein